MSKEISIDKKLCEFVPDPYLNGTFFRRDQYKIHMPEESVYNGYHTLVNATYLGVNQKDKNYLCVWDSFVFTLIKTEREEGKKYKRPKLSYEEFSAIFEKIEQDEKEEFFKDSQLWAVSIPVYSDKGRDSYRIIDFGYLKGAWLHLLDTDERKRISAPGLVLLREVTLEEIEEYKAAQKACRAKSQVHRDLADRRRCFKVFVLDKPLSVENEELIQQEAKLSVLYANIVANLKTEVDNAGDYNKEFELLYEGKMSEREEKHSIKPLQIVTERSKAVLVQEDTKQFWLPKSAINLSNDKVFVVAANTTFIKKCNLEPAPPSIAVKYGFSERAAEIVTKYIKENKQSRTGKNKVDSTSNKRKSNNFNSK